MAASFGPRKYQLEILDHALRENTVAFLPTGSGKTLISILLIKFYLTQTTGNKQLIAFLAPTKILVDQQEKYISSNTDHRVRAYTGDTRSNSGSILDNWGIDIWLREANEVDIMVMTPEIMRNILERNLIPLTRFALFILDECHHAFGKDPMAAVCRFIHNPSHTYRPRILGLTASPLPCKKGSISQKIAELERTTGCKLVAPVDSLEDLNFYVPKPELYTLGNPQSGSNQRGSIGSDDILLNPNLLLHSMVSPSVFDEFKNNSILMSSIFPANTRLNPWQYPIPFFYHNYFRIRHGQHLQEIIILLNTLHAQVSDFPQLLGLENIVSKLRFHEKEHSSKDIPLFVSDLESLLGQLSTICCDCGLIPCLHAYVSAFTTNTKKSTDLNNVTWMSEGAIAHGFVWRNENDSLLNHQTLVPSMYSTSRMKRERQHRHEATTSVIDMSRYELILNELRDGRFLSTELSDIVICHPLELILVTLFDLMAFFIFSVNTTCALKACELYTKWISKLDHSTNHWGDYTQKLFHLRCSNPYHGSGIAGASGIFYLPQFTDLIGKSTLKLSDIAGGIKGLLDNSLLVCQALLETFQADQLIDIIMEADGTAMQPIDSSQALNIPLALPQNYYQVVSLSVPIVDLPEGHFGLLDTSDDVRYVSESLYTTKSATVTNSSFSIPQHTFVLLAPRVSMMLRDLFSQRATTWGDLISWSSCPLLKENNHDEDSSTGNSENNEDEDPAPENEWAAIIFCKMRLTVLALSSFTSSLLSKLARLKFREESASNMNFHQTDQKCEFLIRSDYLIGGSHIKEQERRLLYFKAGFFNVLFATDIAEEGLDVRSCQRVINFDLPATVKSYLQRRGRARARNSVMINMVPEDKTGEQILHDLVCLLKQEEEMNGYYSILVQNNGTEAEQSHNYLAEAEEIDWIDISNLPIPPDGDHQMYRYVVPNTGAVVDINNATKLLIHYCQHLPHDKYYKPDPIYWITTHRAYMFDSSPTDPILTSLYQGSLLLPQNSHPQARCLTGPLASSKTLSKSLISLECIKQLHLCGELDDYLQSTNSRASIQRKKEKFEREEEEESTGPSKLIDPQTRLSESNNPEAIVPVDIKVTPDFLDCDSKDFNPLTHSLYFYAFDANCEKECHGKYVGDCPTCSRYLRSMNQYGLIFHRMIPEDICAENIDFYLRGIKLNVKMEYLGSKVITAEEFSYLQLFHRHILCWESSGFHSAPTDTPAVDLHPELPNDWKRSGQNAWYLIFPLRVGLRPQSSIYPNEMDFILSHDWVEFLASCCQETGTLIRNFFQHHRQTTVQGNLQSLSPSSSLEVEIFPHQRPENLHDKLYSRGGYGGIYIGCESETVEDMKFFDDLLKEEAVNDEGPEATQSVTFQDYYLSKGLISSSQILEFKTSLQQSALPLIKSASLAGRLSLIQILDNVVTGSNTSEIIDERHTHTTISYLLPQQCKVIGEVKWMMIGLVAPSMIWRIQSLLLAVEAREKISSLLPPCESLESIQSCPYLKSMISEAPTSSSSTTAHSKYILPKPSLMLKALTPRRTHEILDSERLEFLGDIILKYVVSWILYCCHWNKHEGYLTRARVEIISNSFLTKRCRAVNLLQYLRAHPLSSGKQELYFSPPGRFLNSYDNVYEQDPQHIDNFPSFSLWNINILKPVTQKVNNKISHNSVKGLQYARAEVKAKRIADLMEALIGAFYESGGINCAIGLIRAFGLWPSTDPKETLYPISSTSEESSRASSLPIIPPNYPIELARIALGPTVMSDTRVQGRQLSLSVTQHTVDTLSNVLGYTFKNHFLLDEALTHCSLIFKKSNQRLEYLGDAVLDYVTMTMLYDLLPSSSHGKLSILKSQLLCNSNLSRIVVNHRLYHHLQVMSTVLMNQLNDIEVWMRSYEEEEQKQNQELEEEERMEIVNGDDDQFQTFFQLPDPSAKGMRYEDLLNRFDGKFLADMLESLFGAVFIDSNLSTEVIARLIKHLEIIPKSYFENQKSE